MMPCRAELSAPMFEPFEYQFFLRGVAAAVLVGGLCGAIGVYIVLKRMAYIGHGLSHAILGGAVVSFILSFNFLIGATVWGFLCAQLITLTTRKRRIAYDAAIGVITTVSFAIGIVIISRYQSFTRDFDAALFGNILGVTPGDLLAVAVVTALTAGALFIAYKQFLFTTFDGDVARYYGVPVNWMETLFSLVLAAVIVVSLQIFGVLLIAGATVIPPVAARMLTNSFPRMLLWSVLIGAVCGFAGIYLSYFFDLSSGASIVILEAVAFAAALAFSSLRGRLSPARRRPAPFPAGPPAAPEPAPHEPTPAD